MSNTSGPKVKCKKCSDVIQSTHVHDFKTCKCGAISIDGGNHYTRTVGEPGDFEWIDQKPKEEITKGMLERALAHLADELQGQYETNPMFKGLGFDSSRYWAQLQEVAKDPRNLIGNTPEKDAQ